MASYSEYSSQATKKVRVFGDWDKNSSDMVSLLQARTKNMFFGMFKNLHFVTDFSYEYAVVFNYPIQEINIPEEKVIGLILEPPEILDVMYPDRPRDKVPGVGRMFSFCHGTEFPAYPGLGFATVNPSDSVSWPPFTEKHAMMIVSNKVITPWHQKRQEIFHALLKTDLEIDFYGRGMDNPDPRCHGEIDSYGKGPVLKKYSICIDFENSPHGAITDKFFDPVLSNTIPITNAKELIGLAPDNSFFVTDWDLSVGEIVEQISDYLSKTDSQIMNMSYELDNAKNEILEGKLNLTNWIYERLNECE